MKSLVVLIVVSVVFVGSFANAAETPAPAAKVAKILDRPLIPTGYGLTKLLKEDFYLGQLLIDNAAVYRSSDDLVFIDAARRMEFKFVTDKKISGRTFVRILIEGMKINNSPESLKTSMANIRRFKGFFKRSIKKGDVVRFDYHKNFGTRVYLNKRMLGEIPYSLDLYRCLLNIWLGERPPSSKFKLGLLGQNGDEYAIELQQRYHSI